MVIIVLVLSNKLFNIFLEEFNLSFKFNVLELNVLFLILFLLSMFFP